MLASAHHGGENASHSRAVETAPADIVLVAFKALGPDEQDEAYAKITDARVTRLATDESEMARHLRSLRRVAEVVDGELTPEKYSAARQVLVADGEEITEIMAIRRFFGSWSRAKEALGPVRRDYSAKDRGPLPGQARRQGTSLPRRHPARGIASLCPRTRTRAAGDRVHAVARTRARAGQSPWRGASSTQRLALPGDGGLGGRH